MEYNPKNLRVLKILPLKKVRWQFTQYITPRPCLQIYVHVRLSHNCDGGKGRVADPDLDQHWKLEGL
jgi:hypothetical protein